MPLTSFVVLGVGLALAFVSLFMLLTVLSMPPRAKTRLVVFGHQLNLNTSMIILGVSSVVLMILPLINWTMTKQEMRAAYEEESPFHGDDRANTGAGQVLSPDQQERPGQSETHLTNKDEPFNLAGEWVITNTVLETSYAPYKNLQLVFRMAIQQDGHAFRGVGEKHRENGQKIPVTARRPIKLQGSLEDGPLVSASFQETGLHRSTGGRFDLNIADQDHLQGTFVSTAANARGISRWTRVSSQQVAEATKGDQKARMGVPTATPAPPPAVTTHAAGVNAGRRANPAQGIGGGEAGRADQPRKPTSKQAPAAHGAADQHRLALQLGMSRDAVRDLLGEPVSIEDTPRFIFWRYGDEKFVVFEQGNSGVYGWVGLSP